LIREIIKTTIHLTPITVRKFASKFLSVM
jgi:hypothetical protein